MDEKLTIQEIRQLSALKTGNINISDNEAISVINSVLPGFNSKEINPFDMDKSYFTPYAPDPDTSQFVFDNMLYKLGFKKNEEITIFPPQNIKPEEPSDDDVKFFAIDFLREDTDKALRVFNNQIRNQGYIGKFYGEIKNIFETDFSQARVTRILAEEELAARLLELAQTNQLDEKRYLNEKLDLAVKLLGNDSENAEIYRKALAALEPQELTSFINKILSPDDKTYNLEIPKVKETILNQHNEQVKNKPQMRDAINLNIKKENPNSVESIIQNNNAYRPMSFEEVFALEKGVNYNSENIKDCTEKQTYLSLVLAAEGKTREVKEKLFNATQSVEQLNGYGGGITDASGAVVNNLERKILSVLNDLYKDELKVEEFLNRSGAELINGKIEFKGSKAYGLVSISKHIQKTLDKNYNKLLNGKTLEQYETEYQNAYKLAYGSENSTRLAEAFVQSQQNGIQYIKTGVQSVGMAACIAGQLIPGGQAASALIWSGLGLSTAGGAAVQLTEDVTKAGGITGEDAKAIGIELAQSAALLAAGYGTGKLSSLAFSKMVMANCNHMASLAAKYGTDVVLGAAADMVITGEYNLTQESITNLIPVMVGLAKTKGSMVRYVEKEMLDAVGTLPKDYFKENQAEFDRVMEIMLKNETKLGYLSQLDDTYWNEIIKSSQNPPVGEQYNAIMEYKKTSKYINPALSEMAKGRKIDPKLETTIKNITDYINTTHLSEPLTVYRDDDGFKLSDVILPNGKNLGEILDYLYNNRKTMKAQIKEFEAYLKSVGQSYEYTQERFMSATFVYENRFESKKSIRYELYLPQETKGTFIESYNNVSTNGKEIEYLIQRDTKTITNSIEWSDEFDCWYIKANTKQNNFIGKE